jgi:hypothetical protein
MESVAAIKESTLAQFRPHIQIDFVFKETAIPLIRVQNIGSGAAVSIELKYRITEIETQENLNIIPKLDKGDKKQYF